MILMRANPMKSNQDSMMWLLNTVHLPTWTPVGIKPVHIKHMTKTASRI